MVDLKKNHIINYTKSKRKMYQVKVQDCQNQIKSYPNFNSLVRDFYKSTQNDLKQRVQMLIKRNWCYLYYTRSILSKGSLLQTKRNTS